MHNYYTNTNTECLLIRPLTMHDVSAWQEFMADYESIKLFPTFVTEAPNSAEIWIEKQIERYAQNRFGLMALIDKSTNEFVGQCGLLSKEVDGVDELEIGYSLMPKHTGKGYATEAAQAFKAIAFDNNYTQTVISIIHIDNIPSQKVAERNGMTRSAKTNYFGIDAYVYRVNKVI
ncbi:MAG: GNAT family N-acetyltransferase [Bacteroidia bacterium]